MTEIIQKQWELAQKRFEFLEEDLVEKIKTAWEVVCKADFHGCFELEEEVYHNMPGVANGQLNLIKISPLRYYKNNFVKPIIQKKDCFIIGNMIHKAVLEPMEFQKKYVSDEAIYIKAGGASPRNKKEYKEYKKEVVSSGKYLVKYDDYNMCIEIVDNVYNHHPKFRNVLKDGLVERCVFAIDPKTGVLMRVKPDSMKVDKGEILDVKSTQDASLKEFERSSANFKYYCGSAFYLYVCSLAFKKDFTTYMFGCIEKVPPYDTIIYNADDGHLGKGEEGARENINTYAACLGKGEWPGLSKDIEPLGLPSWAF